MAGKSYCFLMSENNRIKLLLLYETITTDKQVEQKYGAETKKKEPHVLSPEGNSPGSLRESSKKTFDPRETRCFADDT